MNRNTNMARFAEGLGSLSFDIFTYDKLMILATVSLRLGRTCCPLVRDWQLLIIHFLIKLIQVSKRELRHRSRCDDELTHN